MRFEGTRPSGKDPDVPVYIFTMGIEEVKIVTAALSTVKRNTPHLLETEVFRARIRNMVRILGNVLRERSEWKS